MVQMKIKEMLPKGCLVIVMQWVFLSFRGIYNKHCIAEPKPRGSLRGVILK